MSSITTVRTRRPRAGLTAFTLVEMLAATAVFGILVVLILTILGQLDRSWVQMEAENQRQHDGRDLLNYLARDIQKAMLPVNAANSSSLQFVINPSTSGSTTYSYHDNIFFQAPVATDTSAGEVAEVGYFVQWQGTSPQLCRFFVNPTNANYTIYSNPTGWLSTTIIGTVAPGTKPAYQGLLGENVVGLWINAYDSQGNFVMDSSRRYDSRTTSNLPAMIDVSILVLDPATAARVASSPAIVNQVKSAVTAAAITNAAQCMASLALAAPVALRGASCFTTRVQLLNSR